MSKRGVIGFPELEAAADLAYVTDGADIEVFDRAGIAWADFDRFVLEFTAGTLKEGMRYDDVAELRNVVEDAFVLMAEVLLRALEAKA